jgi:hypothetical protein
MNINDFILIYELMFFDSIKYFNLFIFTHFSTDCFEYQNCIISIKEERKYYSKIKNIFNKKCFD